MAPICSLFVTILTPVLIGTHELWRVVDQVADIPDGVRGPALAVIVLVVLQPCLSNEKIHLKGSFVLNCVKLEVIGVSFGIKSIKCF